MIYEKFSDAASKTGTDDLLTQVADRVDEPDFETHIGLMDKVRSLLPDTSTMTEIAGAFATFGRDLARQGYGQVAELADDLASFAVSLRDYGFARPALQPVRVPTQTPPAGIRRER